MEIGGSPKSRCAGFALLSSAARYSATPRTRMLPSTWFPKQEEKKSGELLFGELHQLHKRLEGISAYGERKKTRDLVQKSIQLMWEGTDLPRDSTEYRSETHGQAFVLMQSAHVGTCTQNKSFARELIIIGFFAQLLGLNHKFALTTQLCLLAGGSSFSRAQPLLPSYSSWPSLLPTQAPKKVKTVDSVDCHLQSQPITWSDSSLFLGETTKETSHNCVVLIGTAQI